MSPRAWGALGVLAGTFYLAMVLLAVLWGPSHVTP